MLIDLQRQLGVDLRWRMIGVLLLGFSGSGDIVSLNIPGSCWHL